jgi:hypothetical protein
MERLYNDVLLIEGISKNILRNVKQVLLKLKITDYIILEDKIVCIKKIGTHNYSFEIPFTDFEKVYKYNKIHFRTINSLERNIAVNDYVYGYFKWFAYNKNGKYVIKRLYTFNTNPDIHTPINNATDFYDFVFNNISKNDFITTSDFLGIPIGVTLFDLRRLCEYQYNYQRDRSYWHSVTDSDLKYLNIRLYSYTDEKKIPKEIFYYSCNDYQKAYIRYLYPNDDLARNANYQIYNDYQIKLYNMPVLKKLFNIDKKFISAVNKHFAQN